MMACTCNPSYLGGWGRRIGWTCEAEVAVGRGCSERRLRHCTPAWVTETQSQKKEENTLNLISNRHSQMKICNWFYNGNHWLSPNEMLSPISKKKIPFFLTNRSVAGATGVSHHALLFKMFVEMGVSLCCPGWLELLILRSTYLNLPKCWDYRHEPPSFIL